MSLPRHQKERDARAKVAAESSPDVVGGDSGDDAGDITGLQIEIDGLETTLRQIEAGKDDLEDATRAAQQVVTTKLRLYAQNPTDEAQDAVSAAEERLKECRRRQFTTQSSEKVIRADLGKLKRRLDALVKQRSEQRRAAALGGLKDELKVLEAELKTGLVRWAALKAVVDGHPAGMANPKSLYGREERITADEVVGEIKATWRE